MEKVSERLVKIKKNGQKKRVAEYRVTDETGTTLLTVWGFIIDKISSGQTLLIENGYVSEFNGCVFLNIGKFGNWTIVNENKEGAVNEHKSKCRFVKIASLRRITTDINLEKVKVLDINNMRHVKSRKDGSKHQVADVILGDETGCIKCALWDEKIREIKPNMIIRIFGAYVTIFRGIRQLNFSKNSTYEILPLMDLKVNIENNLSI